MQNGTRFPHQHILDGSDLTYDQIMTIFSRASDYLSVLRSPEKTLPDLMGTTVVLAFFERSTRTRVSFEIAARRLSADLVTFEAGSSSVGKGESLLDTLRTIEAMHIDILVMRHAHSGAPHFLTEHGSCSIINAGDGEHQHPTQGLLDAFTLYRYFGEDIRGLDICIVGDVLHSRVARSNIDILKTLGANVAICGPGTLMPQFIEAFGVRYFATVNEAVEWADVLNILRIQQERMDSGLLPTLREFSTFYGIYAHHLVQRPELLVMHPGPINRGVELSPSVADHTRSLILQQVECGVAIRMALLALVAGSAGSRQ